MLGAILAGVAGLVIGGLAVFVWVCVQIAKGFNW